MMYYFHFFSHPVSFCLIICIPSLLFLLRVGQITVVGPDAPYVQQAREMLELFTETFELKTHQIEYLSHDYSMLGEGAISACWTSQ